MVLPELGSPVSHTVVPRVVSSLIIGGVYACYRTANAHPDVGGSGYVGTLMLAGLAADHEVRVLDLVPPQGDHDHVVGSATDPQALAAALDGMDAVVHAAMGRRSETDWPHPETAVRSR